MSCMDEAMPWPTRTKRQQRAKMMRPCMSSRVDRSASLPLAASRRAVRICAWMAKEEEMTSIELLSIQSAKLCSAVVLPGGVKVRLRLRLRLSVGAEWLA